jgi:D-2-hydroxyacid dehydrogenase (NADP+)
MSGIAKRAQGKTMTNVLIVETYAESYATALREQFPKLGVFTAASADEDSLDGSDIDVLIAFGIGINDALLARMQCLQWVQSLATGVDHFLRSKTLRPEAILTSGRGIHGPAMRETVLHLMLSMAHDSNRLVANRAQHLWERRPWPLLAGKTALVVGTGVSASAIGKLLQALGMRVIGVSRTPRTADGFDEISSAAELPDLAGGADYLVNVLPGSDQNRHMIGRSVFERMKQTAYFINVGRGETVDEGALIACLREGRIAGAGLDVFATEPVPADSPLWNMPNVFLTPHIGGLFIEYAEMAMPIVTHNMRCFLTGQTGAMQNWVDRAPKPS